MNESEFWQVIAAAKGPDPEDTLDTLVEELSSRDVTEILAFGYCWETVRKRAYHWPLWGAAYLINGGCSDDGFTDFRSWLILQGESVFTAALKNPDSLAALDVEEDEASLECYPAPEAYDAATNNGRKKPDHNAYYGALNKAYPHEPAPGEPTGEEWDFDDDAEMRRRLPKLFKKFSTTGS